MRVLLKEVYSVLAMHMHKWQRKYVLSAHCWHEIQVIVEVRHIFASVSLRIRPESRKLAR